MDALTAIPTTHGLSVLTSAHKDSAKKYALIGAKEHNALDSALGTFYTGTIENSFYDSNGVLTFQVELPVATNFGKYLYKIAILDNNNKSVLEVNTPKFALVAGIGGFMTIKTGVTGQAGKVVFKSSNYVTEVELQNKWLNQITTFQSNSDFKNGTLVTTDIDASVKQGESFTMQITGKSYANPPLPFSILLEGYMYNNTFINNHAVSTGGHFNADIKILKNNKGKLCFWWPRLGYWHSFNVYVYKTNIESAISVNHVLSITDAAEPASDKKVTCTVNNVVDYTRPIHTTPPLPVGAQMKIGHTYLHWNLTLDPGVYIYTMYGWWGQLGKTAGAGFYNGFKIITGKGRDLGTYRSMTVSESSGIFHTGLLILETKSQVSVLYKSNNSSFTVPGPNSESTTLYKVI